MGHGRAQLFGRTVRILRSLLVAVFALWPAGAQCLRREIRLGARLRLPRRSGGCPAPPAGVGALAAWSRHPGSAGLPPSSLASTGWTGCWCMRATRWQQASSRRLLTHHSKTPRCGGECRRGGAEASLARIKAADGRVISKPAGPHRQPGAQEDIARRDAARSAELVPTGAERAHAERDRAAADRARRTCQRRRSW